MTVIFVGPGPKYFKEIFLELHDLSPPIPFSSFPLHFPSPLFFSFAVLLTSLNAAGLGRAVSFPSGPGAEPGRKRIETPRSENASSDVFGSFMRSCRWPVLYLEYN